MTAHASCTHPNTPEYRECCRWAERLKAAALRHDLEIVDCPREDRPSAYPHIWQFCVRNPRRSSLSTELLVTCAKGRPRTCVTNVLNPPKPVSLRRAFTWLSIIAI